MATYTRADLDDTRTTRRSTRSYTPEAWAAAQLDDLGIQRSPGAIKLLLGWTQAEGGFSHKNPLNTTQSAPGATNFNSIGVKTYGDWDTAIKATTATLRNGRYGGILDALKRGDAAAGARAIGASPWGTSADLISRVVGSTPTPKGGSTSTHTPAPSKPVFTGQAPVLNKGGEETDRSGAVQAALLDKRKGMSLIARIQQQLASGNYTKITRPSVTPGKYPTAAAAAAGPSAPSSTTKGGDSYAARADAIDAKRLPYLWGGGHAGKVDPYKATPLDCSGAVSAVLGINPRVSGQFTQWGKAGDGGNKGITIYANSKHVLMKIDGKFFGTSRSNPGGGAGWIPRSQMSPAYLAGFTARHA